MILSDLKFLDHEAVNLLGCVVVWKLGFMRDECVIVFGCCLVAICWSKLELVGVLCYD